MNAKLFSRFCGGRVLVLGSLLISPFVHDDLEAQTAPPAITSIRQERTNIVVSARVPSGVRRVTLESRARIGDGAWEPRAVTRLDGAGGTVTFSLPCSRQLELLRVRGDDSEPLPASFYAGTNKFLGEPSSGGPNSPTAFLDARAGPGAGSPTEPSRDVVESDIWKIRDRTLYFFNQYRGLQIIDITNPDSAAVRGTLPLPASGEQMYLLGSRHVVLLARNGCYYSNGQESQVLIVADNSGIPEVVARLSVAGYVVESRMVGSALYVASQSYRPMPGTNANVTIWEWGTLVSSFDLADPAAPIGRGTFWYSGYGNVIAATEQYLFVSTLNPTNWRQSLVRIIDISEPDGTMQPLTSIQPAGQIRDKFKINYNSARGVLTTVSEYWDGTQLLTILETFDLPLPGAGSGTVRKLGERFLGQSERLHATRFDGDLVYVVTFHVQFQLDPLWVVDLSDPAHPEIRGQLEIPGWSTYLHPLGDRLLALGIETNRTTVSLFDVADPASPALLSRVALGSGWSWTEANWDEQAFQVLLGSELILVPFQSWTSNGLILQVQLIDLGTASLELRGVIDHQFQPRRATVYEDRILSVSGRELLSVDFTDRDRPQVRGATELAWPVDRVFVHGDHLIEMANGSRSWGWWDWWSGQGQIRPVIRVTRADDPDHVLDSLTLTNLPVLGTAKQGNYLYIAQGPALWFYPWLIYDAGGGQSGPSSNATTVLLTVIRLDDLPQLSVSGEVETKTDAMFLGGDMQALWPRPGLLVWVGGGLDWWWWRWGPIPLGGPADSARAGFAPWPWFWPSSGGLLLAYDVGDSTAPRFASDVDLTRSNRWSFGQAFTAEGLVYVNHQTSEFVPGLETPWWRPAYTNTYVDETTGETNTVVTPAGSWVQRSFLDVVDYADANDPTVRDPVNIPGGLQGISHQGALLYTLSSQWTRNTNGYITWTQNLDGLAYDGVSAHLVDSLALPNAWPLPILVVGNNIFLGRPGYDYTTTNRNPDYLETWALPDTGKFTQLGRVTLTAPANTLEDFPGMLAVQQGNSIIVLFDIADPANLKLIGQDAPAGCFWFDLTHADGDANSGLWLPLGGFGVAHIPISP